MGDFFFFNGGISAKYILLYTIKNINTFFKSLCIFPLLHTLTSYIQCSQPK